MKNENLLDIQAIFTLLLVFSIAISTYSLAENQKELSRQLEKIHKELSND